MKRILFIGLAIVIAVSCFAVPAFASTVDGPVLRAPVGPANIDSFTYAEKTARVIRGEDFTSYYLSMYEFPFITEWLVDGSTIGNTLRLGAIQLNYQDADKIRGRTTLFGNVTGYDSPFYCMDISNLRTGFKLRCEIKYLFPATVVVPFSSTFALAYLDMYGNTVSSQSVNIVHSNSEAVETDIAEIVLEIPSNAVYLYCQFASDLWTNYYGTGTFAIDQIYFSVEVPNAWFDSEILGNIDSGIGGIGGQLGEIIGSELNPIKPGGSGNLGTDTDSIINNAQGGIDYAGGLLDNIGGALAQTATGFSALTAVFNLFSVMPFFSLLLQLSVTIGLFGLMTGLIGSIVSKFSVRSKGD